MEFQSTKNDRLSLGLTLYMDGFAAVKDMRKLVSESVIEEVQFLDVAERIEPGSIVIRGSTTTEQSFDPGLLASGKLLELYIGDVVTVRNLEVGEETQLRLLSVSPSLIGERVETKEILLNPSGELVLPPLPEGAKMKPSVTWKTAHGPLNEEVHVSYLTRGLGWEAIYIVEIRGEVLSLAGWINANNQTGIDFHDVRLKLVAGQINRQGPNQLYEEASMMLAKNMPIRDSFEERSFGDAHVYALERKVVLLNGQSKQVRFLSVEEVAFKKVYKVEKGSKHARACLLLANTKKNGLGIPLPTGMVKVYEADQDGEMEFTGEDEISHTPVEEKLSLTIGEAFDVISESREITREKREGLEYVTYRYELRNGKQENIRIDIGHVIYEQLWKMESSTHDYEVKNTSEVEFSVRVAAGKSVVVEFTYKVDKHTNLI
ncbi:DUF4139 domain-containing protein [Planomicrobium chinense]|uniref:DUF4139 domain-containing protein n=1 Tax=Planococcus chinensis TaxID=272917 RepID=UPI001CC44E48|nr:DUF4139 domain-containing protein [Planococcus chinensis]MBZ5200798.1 DUF4139 domain-containing protein [Planococcus chinensis]